MKTDEVRERFLIFFKKKDHTIVKSDSLVPHGDPTLLFTGAGMNQFKDYFMGIKKDMKRAASSQKCLRTGDLDNVGRTSYHHSFFEMLGNFSFADYFKTEAIVWAWEFFTKELNIPKEKLQISVHHTDDEAFKIWEKTVGVPSSVISKFGDKDNFWPADAPSNGPNGPCGPCSEIFFDQGEGVGCGKPSCGPDCECDRFAEIWNLVFTQFNRIGKDQLEPLPFKNIDTGMGLERLVCVIQGKQSNFEIDIFEELIKYLMTVSKTKSLNDFSKRKSIYTIADHFRAVAFSIADGAYPSNEGRGYVVRKLIRRATWNGKKLGIERPFLSPMASLLGGAMGEQYPEIVSREKEIEQIISGEEERFLDTLEEGLNRLNVIISSRKKEGAKIIPGDDIFKLYDTFGFPDELTGEIAAENDLEIDQDGFEKLMESQRAQARGSSKIADSIFGLTDLDAEVSKLEATEFLGYDRLVESDCMVIDILSGKEFVSKADIEGSSSTEIGIILNKTPFYAESGGQIGDTGSLENKQCFVEVNDTQRVGNVIIHRGILKKGKISKGDKLKAFVSHSRTDIMNNHTATHLLHAALRKVLGEHVRQMGSEVRAEKFRFDFSFQRALTKEEIKKIEDLVNQKIREKIPVSKEEKSMEKAMKEGAIAFFGDKYGDEVRIVTVADFSKELCGGTHVENTADIGYFKITKESSISSGTRRIEAMTSKVAKDFENQQGALKEEEIKKQQEKKKARSEKGKALDRILKSGKVEEIIASPQNLTGFDGVKLYRAYFKGLDKNGLLKINDILKKKVQKEEPYVDVLIAHDESAGKISAVIFLSRPAISKGLHAGNIAKKLSVHFGGSGGGKDEMGFAGGDKVENVEKVFNDLGQLIGQK